jgi:hypothetical protein
MQTELYSHGHGAEEGAANKAVEIFRDVRP